MKKYILEGFFILFATAFSFAQTTATDFTTNDCNGVSHHLFDALDNGDVIVICWIMPCGPCAAYAEYASDAVQSFAASYPGRVKYFLADDYANTTCSNIDAWALNFNLITDASFSSSDLDMFDYGQAGMPKVVVLGGEDHSIYYNQNNEDITQEGVEDAVALALSENTVDIHDYQSAFSLSIFPNPTNALLNITYSLYKQTTVKLEVLNMLGKVIVVKEAVKGIGKHLTPLAISDLSNGYYFLKITTDKDIETLRFSIIH